VNKPRIAQVLGVEVGEEFTYDFGANQVNRGAFKIGADGKRYYKTGDLWNPCYNEDDLAVIINHPDRIIRKPRWTGQEVEVAQEIRCLWKDAKSIKKEFGYVGVWCGAFWLGRVREEKFPSLTPGKEVLLDEIIGGAQ
jgi:hypothetical protein